MPTHGQVQHFDFIGISYVSPKLLKSASIFILMFHLFTILPIVLTVCLRREKEEKTSFIVKMTAGGLKMSSFLVERTHRINLLGKLTYMDNGHI